MKASAVLDAIRPLLFPREIKSSKKSKGNKLEPRLSFNAWRNGARWVQCSSLAERN